MVHDRLNTQQFAQMRQELHDRDDARDEIIRRSRTLLKDAKHIIYLVHQDDVATASERLSALAKAHASLLEAHGTQPETIGAYADATEEYVEAACFVAYASGECIPSRSELSVPTEHYLCGLSDLTGELARRAVFAATKRDTSAVEDIWEFINTLQGELVQFHLRNGLLRKKYDSIKYNLKKVEETLYDVKLRT